MNGASNGARPELTHLHIVLLNGNGMLFGCSSQDAEVSVTEFIDSDLRAFTVHADNGFSTAINAAHVLSVERITAAEAQVRLARSVAMQQAAEEQARAQNARIATPSVFRPR